MRGSPGRSTAFATMVAAASASAAVRARIVTASATPSEKLRPGAPDVAIPPIPSPAARRARANRDGRSGRSTRPTVVVSPGASQSAISPPLLTARRVSPASAAARIVSKDLVRDASGDGGHRRDEGLRCVSRDRLFHAPGDRTCENARTRRRGRAQRRQFRAEFVEHEAKTRGRRAVGGFDGSGRADSFDDQIDRPVVKMKPAAVGKTPRLSALKAAHASGPPARGRLDRPRIAVDLRNMPRRARSAANSAGARDPCDRRARHSRRAAS